MSALCLDLIPVAVALAITPGRFTALILLFHTKQAVYTSLTFVGGIVTNMLNEGLAFALLFTVIVILVLAHAVNALILSWMGLSTG